MTSSEKYAQQAINLLRVGVENGSKDHILTAYTMVEHEAFSWDGKDELFEEWDKLTDEANEILNS